MYGVRARLIALPWMALALLSAVCCTQLESGGDSFGGRAPSSGAGDGSASGGTSQAGQAMGGAPSAAGGGGATAGTGETGGAGENAGGAGCVDEAGFDGLGCYRCEPYDQITLQTACSDVSCVPFDNATRLPKVVDGKLPELPAAELPVAAAGGSGGGGAGSGGGGSGGAAGVSCNSLSADGTVIYVTGSTAAKPFLQQIAQQLALQKVFVVYTATGSCTGVDAIVNGTLMKTGASPLPATATYWDASSAKACDLPAAGVAADLGISDVFAPSCPGFELTNLGSLDIRDAHGPIQTMAFAVPTNSRIREISQQAAYLVFGFGADAGVLDASGKPLWNDEGALLQRSASSGTQAMLAAAIGVPPGRWKGESNKSSDEVAAALQAAAATQESADASLGILGVDYVDSRNLRAQIRFLAYQDSLQPCAVTPDSSDKAKDKQNVRDGHYPIWGPLHLLYKVDDKGNPQNSAIREELSAMVGYLSGTKPLPNGVKLFDVYASSGLIPECAMRVTRTADGGPISPVRQDNPCSCAFDVATTGKTDCAPCKVQGDCAAGETCSQGYCERP